MDRSGSDGLEDAGADSVASHAPRDGAWAPVARASNPALGPASRVTSTAADMAKFMVARDWLAGRPSDPLPHLPLETYEGIYTHEHFGSIEIRHEDERLVFVRGNLRGTMSHWDRDSFLLRLEQTAFLYDIVTFTVGSDRQTIELLVFDQGGFRKPESGNHH